MHIMQITRRRGRRPQASLGVGQIELAKGMGVAQSTISRWLRGEVSIAEDDLSKLCDLTGLTAEEIKKKIPKLAVFCA